VGKNWVGLAFSLLGLTQLISSIGAKKPGTGRVPGFKDLPFWAIWEGFGGKKGWDIGRF